MNPDDFANNVIERFGVPEEFTPTVYYDHDGDCIELFVSDEPFRGKRLDKWVTVYFGRDCNDVVGSLIKNVREILTEFPGMDIDIHGRSILLSHMLRGPAYAASDEVQKKTYRSLLEKLDRANLAAELELA